MTYLESNKEEPQFKKTDAKNLFKGASHFRKFWNWPEVYCLLSL